MVKSNSITLRIIEVDKGWCRYNQVIGELSSRILPIQNLVDKNEVASLDNFPYLYFNAPVEGKDGLRIQDLLQ